MACGVDARRHVLDQEVRLPRRRDRVGRGQRHAVAVGVEDVLALPRLRRGLAQVQVAAGGDHLGLGSVVVGTGDAVTVGDQVVERRVGQVALQLLERVGDDALVEQRDVEQLVLVVDDVLGRLFHVVVVGVGLRHHVGQAHALARGQDVVLDVRRLARRLARLDPHRLDERRVGRAGDDADEGPEPDGHRRQHPAALPDVVDEQAARQQRDEQQQLERRQRGVDVGVGGALHVAPARERERVAGQVVVDRLDQRERGQDHRHVRLDLRSHPLERALRSDAAVQVVGHQRDQQDDDQRVEQPLLDPDQEGQLEHVEADVGVERGVLHPELLGVGEQDPLLPEARLADPGDEAEEQRHHAAHQPLPGRHEVVVAGEQLVLGTGRPEGRRRAVRHREADEAEDGEGQREDGAQRHLGRQDAREHRAQAEIVEPEIVGVEARHPSQRGDEQEQHDDRDDQQNPTPTAGATAATRHVGRRSHEAHSLRDKAAIAGAGGPGAAGPRPGSRLRTSAGLGSHEAAAGRRDRRSGVAGREDLALGDVAGQRVVVAIGRRRRPVVDHPVHQRALG